VSEPLSHALPGTWQLEARFDTTAAGGRKPDPLLGDDPIALLFYDRAGHFAAQFMKRDRASAPVVTAVAGTNNTMAQGGYDAYFGEYSVNDATGEVTQTLVGTLSAQNVGMTITRKMSVQADRLEIELHTNAFDGTPVTRKLIWKRVG
jgi:hypothetical protein